MGFSESARVMAIRGAVREFMQAEVPRDDEMVLHGTFRVQRREGACWSVAAGPSMRQVSVPSRICDLLGLGRWGLQESRDSVNGPRRSCAAWWSILSLLINEGRA
jgi:hypothetical protein